MINIRKDLILKELNDGRTYFKFNLHNRLISKLYNHYKCIEMCENFYDSECRYDYDLERIEFCNWQEPYFEGNWDMNQKQVDKIARDTLKEIRKISVSHKNRFYICKQNNQIKIYFYGRDFMKVDYWFIFERKNCDK